MKKCKINLDNLAVQPSLFAGTTRVTSDWFPPLYSTVEEFRKILYNTQDYLGVDFEFPIEGKNAYYAKITGIANRTSACAVFSDEALVREMVEVCRERKIKMVGHSVLGAEIQVIKVTTGIEMSFEEWDDTILKHYLLNMDLTKAPGKTEDEAGALGFNSLWTAASLVLTTPCWKQHQGKLCDGTVCPACSVLNYCSADAWASLELNYRYRELFEKESLPEKTYIDLRKRTDLAERMHQQGIRVDMSLVETLEKKGEEIKESLFPFTKVGKEKVFSEFNPRSNDQILKWFDTKGIKLAGTSKPIIRKTLEKVSKNYGYSLKDDDNKFSLRELEDAESLPAGLDRLYKLYQFKDSGKGLDPWFAQKYRDKNDFIYPRFITIGASTTRWSSSSPNMQNLASRGWASLARACIIPRDGSVDFLYADFSNLELRICLLLAGADVSHIGKDAFAWLVGRAEGRFDYAAEVLNSPLRQAAKMLAHSSNYGEGIVLLSVRELESSYIQRQIQCGAIRVYLKKYNSKLKHDWVWRNKIVAFTGSNLAERLFGSKTFENRKKALELLEDVYFASIPLRDWQWSVMEKIENSDRVIYPTGHFLRLYNTRPEEDIKMALAALGQGTGAQHVQEVFQGMYEQTGITPSLQIHDSGTWEIPSSWTSQQRIEYISLMGQESSLGFKGSYKAYHGKNWIEYSDNLPEDIKSKALVKFHEE